MAHMRDGCCTVFVRPEVEEASRDRPDHSSRTLANVQGLSLWVTVVKIADLSRGRFSACRIPSNGKQSV